MLMHEQMFNNKRHSAVIRKYNMETFSGESLEFISESSQGHCIRQGTSSNMKKSKMIIKAVMIYIITL